jgi:hypothetical protein
VSRWTRPQLTANSACRVHTSTAFLRHSPPCVAVHVKSLQIQIDRQMCNTCLISFVVLFSHSSRIGAGIDCWQGQAFTLLQTVQTGPGVHPASHLVSTCVISWRYSCRGAKLPVLHVVPRLRMSGAVPPPPSHPCMTSWRGQR